MDTGPGGAGRIARVVRVRGADVNGVHLGQAGVEGVVVEAVGHAVAIAQRLSFLGIAADDGPQFAVAGMSEGREHGHLSDVAEPDDTVADALARAFRPGHGPILFNRCPNAGGSGPGAYRQSRAGRDSQFLHRPPATAILMHGDGAARVADVQFLQQQTHPGAGATRNATFLRQKLLQRSAVVTRQSE